MTKCYRVHINYSYKGTIDCSTFKLHAVDEEDLIYKIWTELPLFNSYLAWGILYSKLSAVNVNLFDPEDETVFRCEEKYEQCKESIANNRKILDYIFGSGILPRSVLKDILLGMSNDGYYFSWKQIN